MGKHIIINNARCSFPQFKVDQREDGSTFNPGITVLLDSEKHGAVIAEMKAEIKAIIQDNAKLRKQPPKGDKLCLRGQESESWREEYEGHDLMLRAGNPRTPLVLRKDLSRMTPEEAEAEVYSGCYVNVKVELWGQANQYGRRVNAKLIAVQFAADGPSFDGSYVSEDEAVKGFGTLEEDRPTMPEGSTDNDFLD